MAKKKVDNGRTGLISVDDSIDAIGKAALEDARRREAVKKAQHDTALRKPPAKRP